MEILEAAKSYLIRVLEWGEKWRMKVSMEKTEICIFSLINEILEEARAVEIMVGGRKIKYNTCPKILGVTLDEKLKFDKHIEIMEKKVHRALELLRKVKEAEGITQKCMLQLYHAMITPQLEYAAPVWQVGNYEPLNRIQRKGLSICLGVPGTGGIEAMEVEAGVKPLDIRREELSIRQATRVIMKDNSELIKSAWDSWIESDVRESKISPFGLMHVQLADMMSNTDIKLHNLEKEFNYMESLQPSKRMPEYWRNLGSSKNRTGEQKSNSREIIGEMVRGCGEDTIIAFTDGSCLGNPGPCGSGACIYLSGVTDPTRLRRPVCKRGFILLGELVAIQMVVEYITNYRRGVNDHSSSKLHIFSDSQSAVGLLTLGWEATSHKGTVMEGKAGIQRLQEEGVSVQISWTPGHSEIHGNELADQLAKEAANEALEMAEDHSVVTLDDVKSAAKLSARMKWQERWDASEQGRTLYQFRPTVGYKSRVPHQFGTVSLERRVTQLRTGYVTLRDHLYKLGLVDTKSCECEEPETVQHYLLACPIYEDQREILQQRLFAAAGVTNLDLELLLNMKPDDEFKTDRTYILSELETFITNSQRIM